MTRVAILIASHISYDGHINLLDKCLLSLLEQSLEPKSIYISISFKYEKYKTDFKNILQKYGRRTNPKIIFKISKEQRYQMEHFHNIVFNIDINDYDMLMFCDDDDTYHYHRVSRFVSAFNNGKDTFTENFGGVKECQKKENNVTIIQNAEYWCYGVLPSVIVEFFNFFEGEYYRLLQHKFGDLYFRRYLSRNSKYSNYIGIKQEYYDFPLYNYNKNLNSICGLRERYMAEHDMVPTYEIVMDSILSRVLDCNTESDFDDIMEKSKLNYVDTCNFKYIYNVCKLLCK